MSVVFSTQPSPGAPPIGTIVGLPGSQYQLGNIGNATVVQLPSGGYRVTGYAGYVNIPDAAPPPTTPAPAAPSPAPTPTPTATRAPQVQVSGGLPPMGNIWAPEWMGFSPVLSGIRDTEFSYDLPPIQVAGQAYSSNNQLPIGGDADFVAREIQFVVTAVTGSVSPSDIRVRLRSGDGRLMTTDFVPIVDLSGPIAIPWPLRKGSIVLVDYYNANSNNTTNQTVGMILKGWKRKFCSDPTETAAPYVPMWKLYAQIQGADIEDFEYPFMFSSTMAQDILQIPLPTDNDADFLWCGIAGDWNTANNDVATVGSVGLTFYDNNEVPLSLRGQANPWNSPNVGMFRENVLSSGGGRPMPFYPALFIPRSGLAGLVDISFGGAATVRFSLRGFKLYGGCAK